MTRRGETITVMTSDQAYRPIDLSAYCTAGVELVGDESEARIGEQRLRVLVYGGERRFQNLGLVGGETRRGKTLHRGPPIGVSTHS